MTTRKLNKTDFTAYLLSDGKIKDVCLTSTGLNDLAFKGDIEDCLFENVLFKNCDFERSSIQASRFHKCLFESCHFTGTQICNSAFEFVQFDAPVFEDVRVSSSCWNRIRMENGELTVTTFDEVSAKMSSWCGSRFEGVTLKKCDFPFSNFSNSRFNEVFFSNSDFTGSLFRNASLERVNFASTRLTVSCFDDALISEVEMSDTNCLGLSVIGVDISRLDRKDARWEHIFDQAAPGVIKPAR
jgi:fluoroquinolone resistance protein